MSRPFARIGATALFALAILVFSFSSRPAFAQSWVTWELCTAPAVLDLSVFEGLDLNLWCSPAIRCRETARLILPGRTPKIDERLWEQDFGEWEGLAFEDLPDLGEMSDAVLAAHRAPEGESFEEVCARVELVLAEASVSVRDSEKPIAIVAHAGVIRGALAKVTSVPAALRFEIAPLSVTRFRCLPDGTFSVISVNGALS